MALLFHFGSVTDRESVGFWDVSGACRRGYFCSDVDVGRYCKGKYQPEYQTPPVKPVVGKSRKSSNTGTAGLSLPLFSEISTSFPWISQLVYFLPNAIHCD